MYSHTVLGIAPELFDRRGSSDDPARLVSYKQVIRDATGEEFRRTPARSCTGSIRAVFRCVEQRARRLYRRREHISDDLGTAVNIQVMVFGNLEVRTPARESPSPATRPPVPVVCTATTCRNARARTSWPASATPCHSPNWNGSTRPRTATHRPHEHVGAPLPRPVRHRVHHQRGTLWMLQTRVGKRTAEAAFRIAEALVDEELIGEDEALARVSGAQLARLMFPRFEAHVETKPLAHGVPASPGAAVGAIAFDSAEAVRRAATGEKVILVRRETTPDDLPGMVAAEAVLTSRGGKTSHAAVVARAAWARCACAAPRN